MKKKKSYDLLVKIIGSLLLCVAMFLVSLILGETAKDEISATKAGIYIGVSFLLLSVCEGLWFFENRKKENKIAFFRLGYLALCLAASVCSFMMNISEQMLAIACLLYLAVPLLKRVAAIVKNHRKRNVILNVLIAMVNLVLMALGVLSLGMGEARNLIVTLLVCTVLLLSCLIHIGMTVFSNIKIELLKKIVKKTYAGEILFGLLLLIIAFSVVLMSMEENINTFGDALWYCFAVVTTIGFGDIAAGSLIGRILTVILGAYGIVVVSIITSIIVNFYSEVRMSPDDEEEEIPEEQQEEVDGLLDQDTLAESAPAENNMEERSPQDENDKE